MATRFSQVATPQTRRIFQASTRRRMEKSIRPRR